MNTHIAELLEKFKQLSKEEQRELIKNIEANNQNQNTEILEVANND